MEKDGFEIRRLWKQKKEKKNEVNNEELSRR